MGITNDTATDCPSGSHWRCTNGLCIPKTSVCDGYKDCNPDGSDEVGGCDLFPETGCKSWQGQKFVKCQNDTDVCTLPQFQDNDCRFCDADETQNQTKWRCNSGLCIDIKKHLDG